MHYGVSPISSFVNHAIDLVVILGLADTLRSEMLLYDISIHMFFPNTMITPGFETEEQTKPAITRKIEEGDTPVSPDQAARSLIKGAFLLP